MNSPIERPPLPPLDLPLPVVPAAAEGSASLAVSDCLYQLAALTAGAFLLATLV